MAKTRKPRKRITEAERVALLLEAIAPKPIDVLGIIDNYGAVHGFPRYADGGRSCALTHEDMFGPCHKRWRYSLKKGFTALSDTLGEDRYRLEPDEKEHVIRFLERRGWTSVKP